MGWKILLPQEIMSEGRKLLEDAGHTVIDGADLRQRTFSLISRNISRTL